MTERQESGDPSYYSEFEFLMQTFREHGRRRGLALWRRLLSPRSLSIAGSEDVTEFLKGESHIV